MLSVELREAVANLYNQQYRQDKLSQYTYENVCIVPGGRAGLSRVAAVIGDVYCVSTCDVRPGRQAKANMGIVEVLPGSRLHRIRSGSRRVQASGTSTNGVSFSLTLSFTAVTELTLALVWNKKISTASM